MAERRNAPLEDPGSKPREHSTSDDGMLDNPFFDSPSGQKVKSRKLPPFLDHFNARDLKELFKCSIAVWIMTLFIVINPVLRAYGQAVFFGCIVLLIAPPSGIVFIQIMIGVMVLLGVGLGWAWGVITMKAALAARPQAQTNERLYQLQQAASRDVPYVGQLSGQTSYAQVLIFEGFMLDTRVTAVYFCMMCLLIYFLARLRAVNPKFALIQVFGTVISDIYLTTAPLLPSFQGTIPVTLIKPAATAIGIGTLCNIFLFPQSTSHLVLRDVKDLVTSMAEFLEAYRISFKEPTRVMSLEHLQKAKEGAVATYKGLDSSFGFLPLDVSVCRWNVEDIESIHKPLRKFFSAWMGLLETSIYSAESKQRADRYFPDGSDKNGDYAKESPKFGRHQLAQQLEFVKLFQNEEVEDLSTQSMSALRDTSEPLLTSCAAAIEAISETLGMVNEQKYYKQPSAATFEAARTSHLKTLDTLRKNRESFLVETPPRILDPHSHLFDQNGHLNPPPKSGISPLRGVLLCSILEERIDNFAHALEDLLAQVVALEEHRTRLRLWLPTGLRHLGSWIFGRAPTPRVTSAMSELEQEEDELKSKKSAGGPRLKKVDSTADPKSGGTSATADLIASIRLRRGKQRNPVGRVLLSVVHWLSNTTGMYALRVLIATIALAIPAVIPSSAGFYVREKGLWALIMAQLGLVPYMADFTWGILLRVAGTVLGGILGLVAWYIGAGNGPGNPYGIAAIMVPFILVLMWGRLFGPPALMQAFIITAATIYMTVAYSWVDTHIPSYGNPGVGYSIFWRRILLVLTGFGAAIVLMYLPRPPSANRHYRRVLSRTLSTFQGVYAVFVADHIQGSDLKEAVWKSALASAETLSEIAGPIQLLKFEFSSSDFTASGLTKITLLAMKVNYNLYQLIKYTSELPQDFGRRFRLLSGAFEERFVGDLMAVLSMLEHSLETGDALPSVLPSPLMVRAFEDRIIRSHDLNHDHQSMRRKQDNDDGEKVVEDGGQEEKEEEKEEHVGKLLGPVTRDMIERDEGGEFRKYCVAMSSLVQMLMALDEMVIVVKEELGESYIVDLEDWVGAGASASFLSTSQFERKK